MKIKKTKDYRAFGDYLSNISGCDITIEIMNEKNHVHFQFKKEGIPLGILCINEDEIVFAPFEPFLNDLAGLITIFGEVFIENYFKE